MTGVDLEENSENSFHRGPEGVVPCYVMSCYAMSCYALPFCVPIDYYIYISLYLSFLLVTSNW